MHLRFTKIKKQILTWGDYLREFNAVFCYYDQRIVTLDYSLANLPQCNLNFIYNSKNLTIKL